MRSWIGRQRAARDDPGKVSFSVRARPSRTPPNQRSPLLALTDSGETVIDSVLAREQEYLSARLVGIDERGLHAARRTLASLRHQR